MGIFDTIKSVIGEGKSLDEATIKSALEGIIGKDHPELGNILKNIDLSKAGELLDFFKKNGVPDTKEEIQELISKFSTPAKK